MNRILRCCSLLMLSLMLAAGAGLSQPARGQDVVVADPYDWAKKMFDSTEHNFGVVARGSEVTHRFRIKNLYKEDVQISTVSTTCGCTTPQFDRDAVKTGGELYVTITMDTNKFQHQKNSTVTVQFAQPRFAEVRIPVEVYIRSDVVLTPGSINFGAVAAGTKTDRSIEIAYAGRPNWTISKVITGDPHVEAKIVPLPGNPAAGTVNYRLDVSLLPGTPVGNLRKQMTLVTDDATGGEIPVIVQARVEGDVTITPSIVQLGTVGPGSDTTKTVLLRSNKPFVIEKVECDSNRQAFRMPALGKEAKPVHVLSLAFTAPTQIGPLYFTAQGTIEGAPAAQAARP
jgi:hypothetical protein